MRFDREPMPITVNGVPVERIPLTPLSLREQIEGKVGHNFSGAQHLTDAFRANPDLLLSAVLAKLQSNDVTLTVQDIEDARYMRPAMQVHSDGSVKIRNFSADSGF